MGCPGTVQFAQIPDMNLTQFEDVVLTWGVTWPGVIIWNVFFFFFQTIPEEANFPVPFSDRGDGS